MFLGFQYSCFELHLKPLIFFEINKEYSGQKYHNSDDYPKIIFTTHKGYEVCVHTKNRCNEREGESNEGHNGENFHDLILLGIKH